MPAPPRSSQMNEATVRAALDTATAASNADARVDVPSAAGAPSYPVLVGRDGCQKPDIHAGNNNLTTTREVSPSESEPTPQTARPNLPGLLPTLSRSRFRPRPS
jgi:hypothetical protein